MNFGFMHTMSQAPLVAWLPFNTSTCTCQSEVIQPCTVCLAALLEARGIPYTMQKTVAFTYTSPGI